MRVLLLTRNLPPLVGGMERLNWHLADELSRKADVRTIGPRGAAALAPAGTATLEIPLRPLWRFLLAAHWKAAINAWNWKPDVVLAGSGLTAMPALIAARVSGAVACAYVHGLDLAVENSLYRSLWHPALRSMDRVIANSRPTSILAEGIGLHPDRVGIVHPGVQLPRGDIDDTAVGNFREDYGLGNGPLLLSVGRLSERKGLREFVGLALPAIVAKHPGVQLLVVGDSPVDALHAKAQSVASIREAARASGVSANLHFLGTIKDFETLGLIYRCADVHVFPVRQIPGDPEGFGMVAVEAAAHGLPTVAFATGGVVDAVEDGQSGRLVPAGDYEGFADAVSRVLSERGGMRLSAAGFAQHFSWRNFGEGIKVQLETALRSKT